MPREEIEPGETLESYFGQTKKKPLIKYSTKTDSKPNNPFQDEFNLQEKFKQLNKLSIKDEAYQEEIHKLLNHSLQDQKDEAKHIKEKAHFPLRFTPNLKSKSKWQVRWHPKATSLVKYAYQIFYGSINTNNPSFNPELQKVLQLSE